MGFGVTGGSAQIQAPNVHNRYKSQLSRGVIELKRCEQSHKGVVEQSLSSVSSSLTLHGHKRESAAAHVHERMETCSRRCFCLTSKASVSALIFSPPALRTSGKTEEESRAPSATPSLSPSLPPSLHSNVSFHLCSSSIPLVCEMPGQAHVTALPSSARNHNLCRAARAYDSFSFFSLPHTHANARR